MMVLAIYGMESVADVMITTQNREKKSRLLYFNTYPNMMRIISLLNSFALEVSSS
jgi:hypothetical protein